MDSAADTPCGVGCPIRRSRAQSLLAAPPSFSQRATSFIASWRQGIHQMPLLSSTPTSDNRIAIPTKSATWWGPRPCAHRGAHAEEKKTKRSKLQEGDSSDNSIPQSLVARPAALGRHGAKPTHARCAPRPKDGKTKGEGRERATCRCPSRTTR